MESSFKNRIAKKHFFSIIILFLLFGIHEIHSQEQGLKIITSKESYAEKIYLQLSSTIFTSDKTVWFKAIVTDANHIPTKLSEVLHVEFIDFDDRILDKKLLKLENGIADSFFQLNETMLPGRYLIRAYTNWNQNFNQDFITKAYIDIYAPKQISEEDEAISNIILTETTSKQFELSASVYPRLIDPKYRGKLLLYLDMGIKKDSIALKKGKEGDYSFTYLLPKDVVKTKLELRLDPIKIKNNNFEFVSTFSKTVLVNEDYLDLQFFPESGKLVDGLTSKVAFKALDYKNEGRKISGKIIDQFDSIITIFESNMLGMGTTYFRADSKKIYHSSIIDTNNIEHKYMLPNVSPKGCVLSVRAVDNDYIRVAVNSNDAKQDSIYFKVQSRGITYNDLNLQLKNGVVNIALKKITLPEGIIKLTVLNKNKQSVCERLVFNYKEEERIDISAKPHLKHYSQRDKTIINLTTKHKDSISLPANLSVLVLNKEQLGTIQDTRKSILTYFLLNSELKGAIEKPSHYFDKENRYRYHDMDALMLTQGWRNYIYSNLDTSTIFKIKPEKTLMVSGTVGEYFNPNKKPKKPLELTMMAFGDPTTVATQKVDSTGHFNFYLGDNYDDDIEFLIQSVSDKGKKKNYTINIHKKPTPIIEFEKKEKIDLVDTTNVYLEKNIERKQAEEDFELASGTITLDEVKLSGYKLTPEREKIMELHGPPDVVIENKELVANKKKWSYGLFSVLMFSYPEDISVRRVGENGGFLYAEAYGADFTFVLIDGILTRLDDYPLLGSLPTEEIKSVEILNNPKNWMDYFYELFPPWPGPGTATFSIISIYTYGKNGLYGVQRTQGISKNSISGFTPKHEFYAPKHEGLTREDWKIPDLRSVVHWEPNITTDIEGNAQVEFYNDDSIGEMLVVVEGITENGKLGYYEMSYEVNEKIEK